MFKELITIWLLFQSIQANRRIDELEMKVEIMMHVLNLKIYDKVTNELYIEEDKDKNEKSVVTKETVVTHYVCTTDGNAICACEST